MQRREIVAIKEWNQAPVLFDSVERAKESLALREYLQVDEEPTVDDSDLLGNQNIVKTEYLRFWCEEHFYESDMELDEAVNFNGIIANILTTEASLKSVATHLAGHLVVGGIFKNDLEQGHRFNWASIVPNPSLKNWKPYLGTCRDKFAFSLSIDLEELSRERAAVELVYLAGGFAAEKVLQGEGSFSHSDEQQMQIICDHHGLDRDEAENLAIKFLQDKKSVLEGTVEALTRNLVLTEQEITDLLKT